MTEPTSRREKKITSSLGHTVYPAHNKMANGSSVIPGSRSCEPNTGSTDRIAEWEDRWQTGRIGFHVESVNEHLLEHYEKITNRQKEMSILVPLCGKSVDLKWLADKGFEVTGIEGVTKACEDFFAEQGVKYVVSDILEIPGGKLFKSEDGRIKIYNCDIFSLNKDILGQFDTVWDRGSIVAIYVEDRQRYIDLMKSVLKPSGEILLAVFEYDWNERKKKGPPHPLFKDDIDKLYGDWCTVEEVGRGEWLHRDLARYQGQWGLSALENVQYFIKVVKTSD